MKTQNIQVSRLAMILTGVILLTLVTFANPSLAEPVQKYSGILTHGEFISCDGRVLDPPAYAVGGTWVLYMDPITTAKVPPAAHITINVVRDALPYVMFDYLGLDPVSLADGVYTYSAIGGDVTVTLDTRTNTTLATFFWAVQFHDNCTERNYRSLTYFGIAGESGRVSAAGPGSPPADTQNIPLERGSSSPVGGALANFPIRHFTLQPVAEGCTAGEDSAPADLVPFPPGFFAGSIALIQRGNCPFTKKITNAFNAGAVMVLIRNNVPTPVLMYTPGQPNIPAYSMDQAPGTALVTFVDANPTNANANFDR